jgi:hypothetical protein
MTETSVTVAPTESELKWLEKHKAIQHKDESGDYITLVNLAENTSLLITLRKATGKYDCHLIVMSGATMTEKIIGKDTMMDAIEEAMTKVAYRIHRLSNEWQNAQMFAWYGKK